MDLALLGAVAAGEALGDDGGGDLGLEGSLEARPRAGGDARSAEKTAAAVSIIPMALATARHGVVRTSSAS